jgi:alpha-mannosidase
VKVLFLADVPSVGFAAFDVRPATAPYPKPSALKVARGSLENARYKVTLDANGDVAQVFDKAAKRNLLSAPHRLAFLHENPREWPAWNMDWTDRQNPPTAYVSGPATVKVVENGPVRVAIEVSRQSEGSEFVQVVRLNAGAAGNRVEFANKVRWHSKESSLKASFPLSVSNPEATYNLDENGTTTSLVLKRADAFLPEPVVKSTGAGGRWKAILGDAAPNQSSPDDQMSAWDGGVR